MNPNPLFYIFGNGIYAYGICMAVGILACFAFLMFTMWYKNFNEKSTDAVLIIGLFGTAFGIFMAMLVQSILNFAAHPDKGFQLGGMTFMGGLIGGVGSFLAVWNVYVYVVGPRTKFQWLSSKDMNATLSDALPFIPIGIAIAHAFGRLGCHFAGCCYGAPADWGLPVAANDSILRIPTQLFEMSFLFLLAGVMAFLYYRYKFNYNFGVYGVAYGIWRFILEFFRDDPRGALILGLQPSQFWSILMVLIGVGYFFLQFYVLKNLMKHPELTPRAAKAAEASPEVVGGVPAEVTEQAPVEVAEQAPIEEAPAEVTEQAPVEEAPAEEKPEVEKPEEKPANKKSENK
ncbi:MAG: prolipoprotein diacylglyceryl transferase [Clostridia bacterium]|nr:prolipoprotein diacylglyceryl transferase [Clostridia bacterium]